MPHFVFLLIRIFYSLGLKILLFNTVSFIIYLFSLLFTNENFIHIIYENIMHIHKRSKCNAKYANYTRSKLTTGILLFCGNAEFAFLALNFIIPRIGGFLGFVDLFYWGGGGGVGQYQTKV